MEETKKRVIKIFFTCSGFFPTRSKKTHGTFSMAPHCLANLLLPIRGTGRNTKYLIDKFVNN